MGRLYPLVASVPQESRTFLRLSPSILAKCGKAEPRDDAQLFLPVLFVAAQSLGHDLLNTLRSDAVVIFQ